jgi:hypothetical protein
MRQIADMQPLFSLTSTLDFDRLLKLRLVVADDAAGVSAEPPTLFPLEVHKDTILQQWYAQRSTLVQRAATGPVSCAGISGSARA